MDFSEMWSFLPVTGQTDGTQLCSGPLYDIKSILTIDTITVLLPTDRVRHHF